MSFKIYTKTGDDGTTGLVGGERVKKSDLRLETYGTIDELNAWLGLVRSLIKDIEISKLLVEVQNNLFIIGSKTASDEKGKNRTDRLILKAGEVEKLEKAIDEYEISLKPLQNFILPGGSPLVSYCHIARTVCRRAERKIVQLKAVTVMDEMILKYINRLSDYLFVLSRKVSNDEGTDEILWNSGV